MYVVEQSSKRPNSSQNKTNFQWRENISEHTVQWHSNDPYKTIRVNVHHFPWCYADIKPLSNELRSEFLPKKSLVYPFDTSLASEICVNLNNDKWLNTFIQTFKLLLQSHQFWKTHTHCLPRSSPRPALLSDRPHWPRAWNKLSTQHLA